MSRTSRLRCCVVSVTVIACLLIVGCGQPVRQDRTIEFSRDGNQVSFQHEQEGVFVADPHGGPATKIFQPDENVVATSRPLASPTDGRLLFATAQPLDAKQPQAVISMGSTPAEGRIVGAVPVRFTCWLRDEPQTDQPTEVRELFSATCGHVGYVSAGLVVRWHPDGKHVLYVGKLEDGTAQHSIFEYDMESGQTRRVFPHAGHAILCDWTPGGSALVCVVGGAANQARTGTAPANRNGIWIGTPNEIDSWWRVPESEQLSFAELPSLIESLRASRPAWTKDDSLFAFVSRVALDPNNVPNTHRLHRVEFASRTVSTVADSDGLFVDLHWSPDGQRLGFVTQTAKGPASLRILEPSGKISELPAGQSVRKFAGFDATGQRLAFVSATPLNSPMESPWWALLLRPDPLSRDSIWIADADLANPSREVFSGMRVTFPLWSPREERLSLWLTFTPRYCSLLSMLRQWGLLPGDPAATIDVATGEISWLAVSPQEELQIGHFHLLKRNHAEAWTWYEKALKKLPATKPPKNWTELTQRLGAPENSQLFEFVCLKQMGRDDEAAAKWLEFEQSFYPVAAGAEQDAPAPDPTDSMLTALGPQAELLKHLIHDLYVAEVFLSVDAVDDAITHFRAETPPDTSDDESLSRSIVLAQLLLIARDHDAYLAHVTNVVRPLALRMWKNPADKPPENSNFVLQTAAGLCVAPLFRADFLSSVSESALEQNIAIWKESRDQLGDGYPAVAVDLVLRAAALQRTDMPEANAAEARIARNSGRDLFAGQSLETRLTEWFSAVP